MRKRSSRPSAWQLASTPEAISEGHELCDLCRAGKLFEVQDWIASGKPVNPPWVDGAGVLPRTPLQIAVERGFHSLVRVLLQAGATFGRDGNPKGPMNSAMRMHRIDLVRLLIEAGHNLDAKNIREAFEWWDPELIELLIRNGADLETGNPLAEALCSMIYPAFMALRRFQDRVPHFHYQANIALRYFCKEGGRKWIALLLAAGADPYSTYGPSSPSDTRDREWFSAIEIAIMSDSLHLLGRKLLPIRNNDPHALEIARMLVMKPEAFDLFRQFLRGRTDLNDLSNGGSSLVQAVMENQPWRSLFRPGRRRIVNSADEHRVKVLEFLWNRGAKWVPERADEITAASKALGLLPISTAVDIARGLLRHEACRSVDAMKLYREAGLRKRLGKDVAIVDQLIREMK